MATTFFLVIVSITASLQSTSPHLQLKISCFVNFLCSFWLLLHNSMSSDEGLQRIRATFDFLVANVDVADSGLADRLYSVGLVNREVFQQITNKQFTTEQHVRILLRSLINRRIKPNEFARFCEALKDKCGEFIVEELDKCDISQLHYNDDIDEVDAGQPMKMKLLVQQMLEQAQQLSELMDQQTSVKRNNSKLTDEGKKPQEDIQRVREDIRQIKDVDESFVQMFVLHPSNRQPLDPGDGPLSSYAFPEFHQLASAWELLTACRLSIDLVRYLTAVKNGSSKPPKPFCSVATSLRQLVDDMLANEENRKVFETSLGILDVSELKGYNTLAAIFDELFMKSDVMIWGHIVVWFAFNSYIARGFPASTEPATLDVFGMYIWFFLDRKLSKDIASIGGWVSVQSVLVHFRCCPAADRRQCLHFW
jgi:hypothetical protein